METGPGNHTVHVIPPKEREIQNEFFQNLASAYGVVNSNWKWQARSNQTLHDPGLRQIVVIPPLSSYVMPR